jgi:hypothetical protein
MGDLLDTIKRSDVVESVDRRTQSTVQTEDLVFNESSEGEVVEEVGEVFPHVCIAVFAKALVVEAVDLGDLARLVVTTEDGHTVAVTELERDEEGHCLDRVVATVNIVAHEEVVGVGRVTADAEQFRQVVLAVRIPVCC